MNDIFPKRLSELRRKNGWSQKETALMLGISQALLSHYEKGIRECGLSFLVRAARVFNCTTDYLLGLSDNEIKHSEPDTDMINSDLKESPELIKGRATIVNTLSLLYSITARIGKSEINKEFNKLIFAEIYCAVRLFEEHYFNKNNFSKAGLMSIVDARAVCANAFSSIAGSLDKQNIRLDLKKEQIEDEYPICSKAFYDIINKNEK